MEEKVRRDFFSLSLYILYHIFDIFTNFNWGILLMRKFDYWWMVAKDISDHFQRSYASPCHARSYQGVRPMTYYYVLLVRTIVLSRASALDRSYLQDLPLVLPLIPLSHPYYYIILPTPITRSLTTFANYLPLHPYII